MIEQKELKSILHYNELTGNFYWRIRPANNVFIGDKAGALHKDTGYIFIRYKKIGYGAHTLAWMYIYGEWFLYLDHKDTVRHNNSIFNLRKANRSYNGANRRINYNNKSGFKGVSENRHGKFEAHIRCRGENFYLGSFETPEVAHEAYCKKAIELFGSFHREGIAS